jgi:radical SAM protein with 4Fe4S-binding SPASM domain
VQRARAHNVPLGAHVDVTLRCDLACQHCYLDDRKRSELTLSEYDELFRQLKSAGMLHLLISGGEIFHRPDGLQIVQLAARHRFELRLITHGGHITKEVAEALRDCHIAVVSISIYSTDAAVHDEVTTVPGSLERTLSGARALVEAGVPVNFKAVLMNVNPTDVEKLRGLAQDVGASIEFGVDIKGGNGGSDDLMQLNLAPAEKAAMLGCVYPGLVDAGGLSSFSPDEYTCMAGNASCYISPDGTVYPCLEWQEEAGNIRDTDFKTIWETAPVFLHARGIRRSSFHGCSGCEKFSHCGLCPARSLRETGSPTGTAASKCEETSARALLLASAGLPS